MRVESKSARKWSQNLKLGANIDVKIHDSRNTFLKTTLINDVKDKFGKQHFLMELKLQIWQDCSMNNSESVHVKHFLRLHLLMTS